MIHGKDSRGRGFADAIAAGLAILTILILSPRTAAQWAGRDGWVEEPGVKSLNVKGGAGHAYLDPASVHSGDDGLIYFNESSDVSRPEEIGEVGIMKDAYDCAKNIKYMCVEAGDWRNDPKSTIHAAHDPALPVYRRFLCGDATADQK
ncbi:MAG: hypothetical protein ACREQH_12525 [Candidatus Binatus sp.]